MACLTPSAGQVTATGAGATVNEELTVVFADPPAPVTVTPETIVQLSPPANEAAGTKIMEPTVAVTALVMRNVTGLLSHRKVVTLLIAVALVTVDVKTGFTSTDTPVAPAAGAADDRTTVGAGVTTGGGVSPPSHWDHCRPRHHRKR